MVSKGIQQILELEDGACLASTDPLVREWNVEILDQIVQKVVADFPLRPSGRDLEVYERLKRRMEKFSTDLEDERFSDHVEALRDKMAAFYKGREPSVQAILRHPMTEKIVGFQGTLGGKSPTWYRLKLIGYIQGELTPTILSVKNAGERDWIHPILENLVYIGEALEPYDIDGSYDDAMRAAIKQFLFKGVITHPIYHNLLVYEEGMVDHSDKDACIETAGGIESFVEEHLVPFLQDPDVEPSREEIEIITAHLEILNDEFSVHQKNLFKPSIKILKSFL